MHHLLQAIKLNVAKAASVCRYLVKVCTVTLSFISHSGARLPAEPRGTSSSEKLLADQCASASVSPLAVSNQDSKSVLAIQGMIQYYLPQHKEIH